MSERVQRMEEFQAELRREERAEGTIEKYLRDSQAFLTWLGDGSLGKEMVAAWKGHLVKRGYAPVTINSMLASLHRYLHFLGREDCRVSFLKIQRRLFRAAERELSREEYQRLI